MTAIRSLKCLWYGHSATFIKDTNRWRSVSYTTCTRCGKFSDVRWEARDAG